jgi:spore germination protein KC
MLMNKGFYLLFTCLFLLTGCWDRTEVNDLAFITSTGYDKLDENEFRISVQIPLPSALGGAGSSGGGGGTEGGPFYVDSESARNITEGIIELQEKMSRELFFGHRRVIVIGDELARAGFKKTLEGVLEQPQSRLSSFVVIAKGDAMQILNSTPHMEKLSAEAIREISKASIGVTVKHVINDIEKPGLDPVIPIVETIKTNNGKSKDKKQEILIKDVGILKDPYLKFIAKDKEKMGVLWLMEEMKGRKFTFPVGEKDEVTVDIDTVHVKPKMKLKNGQPAYTFTIKVSSNLIQNEPRYNMLDSYPFVRDQMEKEIKTQVETILNKTMAEGIDVYGLGWYIYRTDNLLWERKFAENWEEILPNLSIKVKVNADIERALNPGINIRD